MHCKNEKLFSQKNECPDCIFSDRPPFFSGKWTERKDIEQAHISIAYPSFDSKDPRIYSAALLNNILGGSMSSRLFQSLRENHGLCYSIYSYTASFPCAGMLGIYAGLSPDTTEQAMQMIVLGFIEPFSKELPMEYAVELNQLLKLNMEGSIG